MKGKRVRKKSIMLPLTSHFTKKKMLTKPKKLLLFLVFLCNLSSFILFYENIFGGCGALVVNVSGLSFSSLYSYCCNDGAPFASTRRIAPLLRMPQ